MCGSSSTSDLRVILSSSMVKASSLPLVAATIGKVEPRFTLASHGCRYTMPCPRPSERSAGLNGDVDTTISSSRMRSNHMTSAETMPSLEMTISICSIIWDGCTHGG